MKRNRLLPRTRQPQDGWFAITNLADTAQVHIYNEIGAYGITADRFCQELAAIDAPTLDVRINSPGGDVFEGIAIHNALERHPATVHIHVDGVAASIASVIAMAGDTVSMARGSQMMIHEGHTAAVGPAAHMREQANLLDRVSDQIAGFYSAKAGGSVDEWRGRMRKETWYSAEEAVKAGLADEVSAPSRQLKAQWDLSVFNYAGRRLAPPPDLTVAVENAHSSTVREGVWDAGAQEKRLPSPVPSGVAHQMYAACEDSRAENGGLPKDACHLPHHLVDEQGHVGAASAAGVRNALARLGQTQGISAQQKAAAEKHLRAHLSNAGSPAPNDSWTTLTAHLTAPPTTAGSATDPVFAALREKL